MPPLRPPAPLRGILHRIAGQPAAPLVAGPLELTCYSKPGCTLCDKAKEPVAHAARGWSRPVRVTWVNILDDPTLAARWGERIPVVCAGETVLAEGKISERWLRQALDAYLRQLAATAPMSATPPTRES